MDASNITTDSSAAFTQLLNQFNKLELNIQADRLVQKSENEKLAKIVKEYEKTVKEHEKKLNQLDNEKGTERRKYQDDMNEYQKRIDRLEEENKEQSARIDGLEKGVNRLKAQKIKLQEQVTENRHMILTIERWTIVNKARDKLATVCNLQALQLLPSSYQTEFPR